VSGALPHVQVSKKFMTRGARVVPAPTLQNPSNEGGPEQGLRRPLETGRA